MLETYCSVWMAKWLVHLPVMVNVGGSVQAGGTQDHQFCGNEDLTLHETEEGKVAKHDNDPISPLYEKVQKIMSTVTISQICT